MLSASRKFKNVFSKILLCMATVCLEPANSTPIIKVTNINPGEFTERCVILTLFQINDTFLGLMCT
jgi:hypothetical protein